MDERARGQTSERAGTSEGGGGEPGRGREDSAAELPAGEAAVRAIPQSGAEWSGAWQRGAAVEPRQERRVPAESAEDRASAVWGRAGRSAGADPGSGALGGGPRSEGGRGNAASLDAGGGIVEPGTEAEGVPAKAAAAPALWRTGANGRQFPRLAGGAGRTGLSGEHGG